MPQEDAPPSSYNSKFLRSQNEQVVHNMISGLVATLDLNLFFIFHFAVIYGCYYSPRPYAYAMLHYIPWSAAAISSFIKNKTISVRNILSESIVHRFYQYKEMYVELMLTILN